MVVVRVGDADNANGWNFVVAGFGDLTGGRGGTAYGVERFAGDEQRGIAPKLCPERGTLRVEEVVKSFTGVEHRLRVSLVRRVIGKLRVKGGALTLES